MGGAVGGEDGAGSAVPDAAETTVSVGAGCSEGGIVPGGINDAGCAGGGVDCVGDTVDDETTGGDSSAVLVNAERDDVFSRAKGGDAGGEGGLGDAGGKGGSPSNTDSRGGGVVVSGVAGAGISGDAGFAFDDARLLSDDAGASGDAISDDAGLLSDGASASVDANISGDAGLLSDDANISGDAGTASDDSGSIAASSGVLCSS